MARCAWAVLGAAVLAAPAGAQEKPADVINKAVEAHGGLEAMKKFKAATSEATGKLVWQGTPVTYTVKTAVAHPGKSRTETTFGYPDGKMITVVQVVNGDTVKQYEDGKELQLGDVVKGHAKQSARWGEVMQLYPLLDAEKFTLSLGKDVTFAGKKYAVLTVKAKDMPDATLYFERATGRLTHTRRTTLNQARETVVEYTTRSDFKTVEGLTIPMKTVTTHNNKPFLEATVTKFTPLEKLDDSTFEIK